LLAKIDMLAVQRSSDAVSVWDLKKDQYNPCPNMQLAQKNDSIISLHPVTVFIAP